MRPLDFAARGHGPWRAQCLASYRHRLDISRDDVLRREPAQVCDGVHDPGHTSGSIAVAGALPSGAAIARRWFWGTPQCAYSCEAVGFLLNSEAPRFVSWHACTLGLLASSAGAGVIAAVDFHPIPWRRPAIHANMAHHRCGRRMSPRTGLGLKLITGPADP